VSISKRGKVHPSLEDLRREAKRVYGQSSVYVLNRVDQWEARTFWFHRYSVRWTREVRARAATRNAALRELWKMLAGMPSDPNRDGGVK
jgi:hypothetical protein